MTFGQGAIQINAPSGDAHDIAGAVDQVLREHMRAGAEQLDSRTARLMLRRPVHLSQRQVRGRAFSERVTIQHVIGEHNVFGEYSTATRETETLCATAPATGTGAADARVREITEGGVLLEAIRFFWLIEDVHSVAYDEGPGDILIYAGERWRVKSTQRWGGLSEGHSLEPGP